MILCKEDLGRNVDRAVFPFTQGGPFMHVIAAKAVCFREAAQPEFAQYGRQVVENAQVLAQELAEGGLRIVSGGTDNHLMLVDLTPLNLTGRDAEQALEQVNIVGNKNAIPYDTQPPRVTSGLRLGTAALTSRGFGPEETKAVAKLILRRLGNISDDRVGQAVMDEVVELTSRFPVPGLDS
jgi:glycine hydroxymethyltransferase